MLKEVCALIYKASGWKFVNKVPDELRSFVFLGAPHTSNHDFVPGLALCHLMKRNTRFVIKNEWMRFPYGFFMRQAGALGINRSKAKSSVKAMADLFVENKDLVMLIAPEGTRRPTGNWKTGFYYIAKEAGVPIVLGYADYAKKEGGFGKVIYPTDFEKDMKEIMEFYKDVKGKHPENFKLDARYV